MNQIRFAIRTLFRAPAFALTVLITLALGIGANTAIFSFARGLVFEPLPYPDSEKLVMVWQDHTRTGGPAQEWFTPPDFEDLEAAGSLTSSIIMNWAPTLTGSGEPERLTGVSVSSVFFDVVGVRPVLGRGFAPEENAARGDRVIVISDGLWRRRFGADPGAIGRTILLNDEPHTIIGIMPRDFVPPFIGNAELWRPLRIDPANCGRACYVMRILGRVNGDVPVERAAAEVAAIGNRVASEYPEKEGVSWSVVGLRDQLAQPVRTALLVLLGAVGFVLLIACVNVANLLLARGAGRQREVAIRAALGAGRSSLVRQFLTEALVIAAAGGVLGLFIALWGVDLLRAISPPSPRLAEVDVDGVVLAFAAALTLVTGIAFGLLPALHATRGDLASTLKEGGTRSVTARQRLRPALIVAEFAIALVLLAGAGLMLRSFERLQAVDPGFRPDGALVAALSLPSARYEQPASVQQFYDDLLARIAAQPDVSAAGTSPILPMGPGGDQDISFMIDGAPPPRPGEAPTAWYRQVTPGYFEAVGMRLLRGRAIEATDDADAPPVVVVNQTLANRYWPSENPIGKRLRPNDEGPWWTVVGIVADVHQRGLDEAPVNEIFLPAALAPARATNVVVRTTGDPLLAAPALRAAVAELDPQLPVSNVGTLEAMVSASLSQPKLQTLLFGVFAALALTLAAIGIYGVTAYSVSSRTQEIGVRMALGARAGTVIGMVVRGAMTLAGLGIAIGLTAAALLAPQLESLLYQLSPGDPVTYAAVIGILALVGLAAALVPALRAARMDPVSALRAE